MASATFEDHPTDPDKMILRKPRLDQGADYERGFIDGMQYQMQSSVDKAIKRATPPQRTWVGLTDEEIDKAWRSVDYTVPWEQHRIDIAKAIEAKLKEKNNA
jgi:hypothetical protein